MIQSRLTVTTAVHRTPELEERARCIAAELGAPFRPRLDNTITRIFSEWDTERLLVVAHEKLILRDHATDAPYFFHPNMTTVRGFNIMSGYRDLFAEATGLRQGESILDCTLGFAGEATLASYLVGENGRVVGLESVPELALVTREGLQQFRLPNKQLSAAMRRIVVVPADYRSYLPGCASESFDVVYFDPFFENRLSGSEHTVTPLTVFGNLAPLNAASALDACRVARRRVVIKHPFTEQLPRELASEVSHVVSTRRGRLVYSVIEKGEPSL